jgi:hypothetical protein
MFEHHYTLERISSDSASRLVILLIATGTR